MTYEVWQPMFVGMVISILLINDWYFIRGCAPMVAYFIYFGFTDAFIGLRKRLPDLFRVFQYTQLCIALYVILQFTVCYLREDWYPMVYDTPHTAIRLGMIVLAVYGIYRILQMKDTVARYFIIGSACLKVGSVYHHRWWYCGTDHRHCPAKNRESGDAVRGRSGHQTAWGATRTGRQRHQGVSKTGCCGGCSSRWPGHRYVCHSGRTGSCAYPHRQPCRQDGTVHQAGFLFSGAIGRSVFPASSRTLQ